MTGPTPRPREDEPELGETLQEAEALLDRFIERRDFADADGLFMATSAGVGKLLPDDWLERALARRGWYRVPGSNVWGRSAPKPAHPDLVRDLLKALWPVARVAAGIRPETSNHEPVVTDFTAGTLRDAALSYARAIMIVADGDGEAGR